MEMILGRKKQIIKSVIKYLVLICIPVFYVWLSFHRSYNSLYSNVRICMTIVMLVLAVICILFLWIKKIPVWGITFLSIMVLGIIYSFVIPLGSGPDEIRHIQTAYYVSDVLTGDTNTKKEIRMREDDFNYTYTAEQYSPEQYEQYWRLFNDKVQHPKMVDTGYAPLHTNLMAYWLSGFGITIGRLFHLGTVATFMLGRMLNLIFAALCISAAVYITPIARETFFVVAVFPMTLQQIMSYSYDMLAICLGFLVIAWSLRIYFEAFSNKDFLIHYLILLALSICFSTLKSGAYVFALLFPAYILLVRFCKNKKRAAIILGLVLVVVVVGALGVLLYLHKNPSVFPAQETYMDWADANGYSLSYALHHPKATIIMVWNTYLYKGQYYFADTLIGTSLGYLNIITNPFFQFAFIILLCCSLAQKENDVTISIKMRIVLFTAFFITANAIIFEFLITYTPFSYREIMGVQGRYFLPVLPAGLLAFYGLGFKREDKISAYIYYAGILLNIMSIRWLIFPAGPGV